MRPSRSARPRLGVIFPALLGLILLVTLVVIVVLRLPALTTPASPPTGEARRNAGLESETRQISFMSNRDGDWDLYQMTLSSRETVNLTDTDADEGFGSYSNDGGAMTYISNRERLAGEGNDLTAYMMNADGSEQRRVVNDLPTILNILGTGRLDWDYRYTSAPGQYTLVSLRDLNLEVYAALPGADGTLSTRNVSQNSAIDWFASLNAARGWIVFASDRVDDQHDIYWYNAESGAATRLTDDPTDELYPVWASDGQQVLYYSDRAGGMDGGRISLYALNIARTDTPPVQVVGALAALNVTGATLTADSTYAPDGGAQLYMGYDGDWDLYYAGAQGENPVNLTDNDTDDLFPSWRPGSIAATEATTEAVS